MATKPRKKPPEPTLPNWPADAVERWPIDRLLPYARNARKHSESQVQDLAASIQRFGWTIPVLVDEDGTLIAVDTLRIYPAMKRVHVLWESGHLAMVCWEDASKRRWFGKKGREVLQGAGSIKRDCAIWREFFQEFGIPNQAIPPQVGGTKWSAEYFARVTGWDKRTSEHGRDAAVLILGRTVKAA
jgi:hypothetical protein